MTVVVRIAINKTDALVLPVLCGWFTSWEWIFGFEAQFKFDEIQRGKLKSLADLYASGSENLCRLHQASVSEVRTSSIRLCSFRVKYKGSAVRMNCEDNWEWKSINTCLCFCCCVFRILVNISLSHTHTHTHTHTDTRHVYQ
jgi:hypothetical protein